MGLFVPGTGVMNVSDTEHREKERTEMKTFTIDTDNNISAFATQEEAAATTATSIDSFSNRIDPKGISYEALPSSQIGPRIPLKRP